MKAVEPLDNQSKLLRDNVLRTIKLFPDVAPANVAGPSYVFLSLEGGSGNQGCGTACVSKSLCVCSAFHMHDVFVLVESGNAGGLPRPSLANITPVPIVGQLLSRAVCSCSPVSRLRGCRFAFQVDPLRYADQERRNRTHTHTICMCIYIYIYTPRPYARTRTLATC